MGGRNQFLVTSMKSGTPIVSGRRANSHPLYTGTAFELAENDAIELLPQHGQGAGARSEWDVDDAQHLRQAFSPGSAPASRSTSRTTTALTAYVGNNFFDRIGTGVRPLCTRHLRHRARRLRQPVHERGTGVRRVLAGRRRHAQQLRLRCHGQHPLGPGFQHLHLRRGRRRPGVRARRYVGDNVFYNNEYDDYELELVGFGDSATVNLNGRRFPATVRLTATPSSTSSWVTTTTANSNPMFQWSVQHRDRRRRGPETSAGHRDQGGAGPNMNLTILKPSQRRRRQGDRHRHRELG